jgi:hypothetical protein
VALTRHQIVDKGIELCVLASPFELLDPEPSTKSPEARSKAERQFGDLGYTILLTSDFASKLAFRGLRESREVFVHMNTQQIYAPVPSVRRALGRRCDVFSYIRGTSRAPGRPRKALFKA